MFRRTKPEVTDRPAASAPPKPGGKGRPTPTRKEAEAAAKARAKAPRSRKEAARLQRQQRAAHNARMRDAMKTGDERYLPARDRGPVRRFVRDFVDARLSMAELLLPLLLVIMVGQTISPSFSNGLWTATVLLVGADTTWLVFRLRRELRRRFPEESTKGATTYAVLRALQFRKLRLPKPQVKLGTQLPERYH